MHIAGLIPVLRPANARRRYFFAPSQCETSLQSNAVSHWLGANLESAMHIVYKTYIILSYNLTRTILHILVCRAICVIYRYSVDRHMVIMALTTIHTVSYEIDVNGRIFLCLQSTFSFLFRIYHIELWHKCHGNAYHNTGPLWGESKKTSGFPWQVANNAENKLIYKQSSWPWFDDLRRHDASPHCNVLHTCMKWCFLNMLKYLPDTTEILSYQICYFDNEILRIRYVQIYSMLYLDVIIP